MIERDKTLNVAEFASASWQANITLPRGMQGRICHWDSSRKAVNLPE